MKVEGIPVIGHYRAKSARLIYHLRYDRGVKGCIDVLNNFDMEFKGVIKDNTLYVLKDSSKCKYYELDEETKNNLNSRFKNPEEMICYNYEKRLSGLKIKEQIPCEYELVILSNKDEPVKEPIIGALGESIHLYPISLDKFFNGPNWPDLISDNKIVSIETYGDTQLQLELF